MIRPDYEQWHRPVFSYPSLQAFLCAEGLENGIHSVAVNGHVVDFLFRRRTSDILLVVFNGAVRRGPQTAPPFFSGVHISRSVASSFMAINDPSFYLDPEIRLAWYAGSSNLPLQSILPGIIDKVASTSASRIMLMGGSGGGFASLYYATKVARPSIALVWNPQTNIVKYHPADVQRYVRVCFDWREGDVEPALSGITYDLARHYCEQKAPMVLLQNSTDDFHIERHAIPFLKAYGLDWTGKDQSAKGLRLHVGNWGDGHMAASGVLMTYIARQLCASVASWNEAVDLVHFQPSLWSKIRIRLLQRRFPIRAGFLYVYRRYLLHRS